MIYIMWQFLYCNLVLFGYDFASITVQFNTLHMFWKESKVNLDEQPIYLTNKNESDIDWMDLEVWVSHSISS